MVDNPGDKKRKKVLIAIATIINSLLVLGSLLLLLTIEFIYLTEDEYGLTRRNIDFAIVGSALIVLVGGFIASRVLYARKSKYAIRISFMPSIYTIIIFAIIAWRA
jgi:hypothetical protein